MKVTKEGEELVRTSYRLTPNIIERIKKSAIEHRRSVNDEVIVLLEAALATDGGPISAAGLEQFLELRFNRIEERLPKP
jgi:plasmid stability protein